MAETSDTLRLAEEERAKQGIHELEFSFGGERDLHTHFQKCQKNPEHRKFIPVNELNVFDLPEHLATCEIIAWIKCISRLTVKLSVNYVSRKRRDQKYPLGDRRGQRFLCVGSGHVTEYPCKRDIDKMPCPFTDCPYSRVYHEVYGYITVVTAAHVMFDDEEAKNTTIEFFYDNPDDKRGVETARGVKVRSSSIEGDFCELLCVTHDRDFIKHLRINFLTASRAYKFLTETKRKLKNYMLDQITPRSRCTSHHTAKLSLNYVSHNRPSGYPLSDRAGQRAVSVGSGRVIDVSLGGNIDILKCPFTNCADFQRYDLHSSITIAIETDVVFDDEEAKNTTVEFFYDGPDDRRHTVTARGVKLRTSCIGEDFCELVCVTHDTVVIEQLINNFLTAESRRKKYFWNKILPWPVCTTHQTAKLSVNYVSPNRPPGYPLSDRAGQRVVSVGSGRVIDVSLGGNIDILKCPFTNCADFQRYDLHSSITIAIETDVVFDDEEAKNTTVEFFYGNKRHIVTARGVKVRTSSIGGDVCKLLCVTHDISLVRHLTYTLLTGDNLRFTDYRFGKIVTWPICTSRRTTKLSVNYISPNRPPRYPLSDRAGQRVVPIGSGCVTDVSLEGDNGKLPCPFTNCPDLPGDHEVCGYITIVTGARVVIDDEEAKNTIVEFFYDDLDERRHILTARGVRVKTCNIYEDFRELVCVTHDELFREFKDSYLQESMAQKKRLCDLFRTVLPGLESIQCGRETDLKFIVKIRLSNPTEAVEALTVLMALTEEMIPILMHWDFSKNSLQDVLQSARCDAQYMQSLIRFELHTAKFINEWEKTTAFLHLNKLLTNLLDTLEKSNIDSPQMGQNMFSSLIIGLAKYYSTVEMMKKRLNACSSFLTEMYSRNVQKVVDISNDIATVEVTFNRDKHFTTLHDQKMIDYFERVRYYTKCKSSDKEFKHELPYINDIHFSEDRCLSVGAIHKTDVEDIELPSYYACRLCNRKYQHESKSSEDSKCNEDDMILVHIGHPHGQSKHVTIGRQTDCLTGGGFYHQLYTAPTCPGCSGGPVWMIPASGDLSDVYGVPHHGHYGNELNSGCSWTMYPQEIDI